MAHAGGRPLKFQTVVALQQAIDTYFDETPTASLTITGLALALETSRETLMDYQDKPEYSDTVKRAKLRIEQSYELALRMTGRAGDIFALKNFGWKDKTEQEITGTVEIKRNMSPEELDAIIQRGQEQLGLPSQAGPSTETL